MDGQQTGVSADRESADKMEGEKGGSCKDCPIFASQGFLEFGATFAWRSSKLISEGFPVTLFSLRHAAVFPFKDRADVVFESL